MHVHQQSASQPTPPFDAPAARKLRTALGMGPEHVAYGIRTSFGMPHVTPDLIVAWERGLASPGNGELVALAGVLWCSPGELVGAPRSLREHRVARGLAPEDVAHAVGLELLAYVRMEEADEWRGSERQSSALAGVLELTPADLVSVTGREPKLAEMLRGAVTTRWQTYVRPVGKLLTMERRTVGHALRALHTEYQGRLAATPSWGGRAVSADADAAGRDFLDRIVDRFWSTIRRDGG
ncbi:transcriptional regulator with XRE-family HTH domain [Streptomyces aurantiacus]|uniref:helix-turn-helix domain-containing protein n=1 Tax=Streptomyces aurantiacus TaxID=47760 RepID=UPI00279232E8|nr:helix-turn-helix transcriptional regulator [Streptomyces aurantiacus]MDQ0774420.1 transcriptional regulator with XRE-family HTH domain [Streptomyces aurantiacus]